MALGAMGLPLANAAIQAIWLRWGPDLPSRTTVRAIATQNPYLRRKLNIDHSR